MQRDMDLIRELLLAIEKDDRLDRIGQWQFDDPEDFGLTGYSCEAVAYIDLF